MITPPRSARCSTLCALVLAVLSLVAAGCSKKDSTTDAGPAADFTEDTTVESLAIGAGETKTIANGAVVTVTGDAQIDGTIASTDGPVNLRVGGDLLINGAITSLPSGAAAPGAAQPFSAAASGVFLRVTGDVDFGDNATIDTNGDIVITDEDAQFGRTPQEVHDEADMDSGTLPTLIPVPPVAPRAGWTPPVHPSPPAARADGTHRITGNWDLSDRQGDRPVLLFHFNSGKTLQLDDWTLTSPPGVTGEGDTPDAGDDAEGADGKNGMNLNIWNNNGPIKVTGIVTLNLAPGGAGGPANATCASATGGDGGKAGNFRMTASGGIDVSEGSLVINPGKAGDGGKATVTKGPAAAAGCPGATGAGSTATGGNGGDNTKKLTVRGNVAGLANISFGDVTAGNGGDAEATACDGGPGNPCCAGGTGGTSNATGGNGGEASLDLGGGGVVQSGMVKGGNGGNATSTGGNGGPGGACKAPIGGMGGMGGTANATQGNGGSASGSGGAGTPQGGNTGTATATAGNGGQGGNVGFGTVGPGGPMGQRTATAGTPGAPGGQTGATTENDGMMGLDGSVDPTLIFVFCIPSASLAGGGPLAPGMYKLPVTDDQGVPTGATSTLELVDQRAASYPTNTAPVGHFGISAGRAEYDVTAVSRSSEIVGARIGTLPGFNQVDMGNPPVLHVYDGQGSLAQSFPMPDFPIGGPTTKEQEFEVDFGSAAGDVSKIAIDVPGFITIYAFYVVDP